MDLLNWWWRFVKWGFEKLYTSSAWAYDAVAWMVSRGHWQAWGEAARPRIEGTRVLEIGSGPGHLLATLAGEGYDVSAIDLSPQMIAIARRRLVRLGVPAGLVLGRAQALPWPDALFDSVVMTFPAGFAVEPATLIEIRRVLRAGGRLIVVDGARLREDLYGRLVNLAFRVTHGGGGELSSVADLYEQAGFAMTCETQQWPDSSVRLLLGAKRQPALSSRSRCVKRGGSWANQPPIRPASPLPSIGLTTAGPPHYNAPIPPTLHNLTKGGAR